MAKKKKPKTVETSGKRIKAQEEKIRKEKREDESKRREAKRAHPEKEPKKKEAMLQIMENFQRGDYDQQIKDGMKRYEEYRKSRDRDRGRDRKK